MIRYHTTLFKLCQIVMCLGILITACKQVDDSRDDLSRYYFPFDSFPPEGMVYTYRNLQDSFAAPEVWRHIKKGPGLMESINYGLEDDIVQRQYDRLVENGVVTDSLLLYAMDSTGHREHIKVRLPSPHRFPFEVGDSSSVWLSKMEWWQPDDSLHIVLERRRKFMEFTTCYDHGKVIPAVRFSTEDTFETEADGWTSTSWVGEELYALDIGLVYYKRVISNNMIIEFTLDDRQ